MSVAGFGGTGSVVEQLAVEFEGFGGKYHGFYAGLSACFTLLQPVVVEVLYAKQTISVDGFGLFEGMEVAEVGADDDSIVFVMEQGCDDVHQAFHRNIAVNEFDDLAFWEVVLQKGHLYFGGVLFGVCLWYEADVEVFCQSEEVRGVDVKVAAGGLEVFEKTARYPLEIDMVAWAYDDESSGFFGCQKTVGEVGGVAAVDVACVRYDDSLWYDFSDFG